MKETKYNNDVPYERVVFRVLQNYSQMQIKLYRLQNKVREQSDKLVFCNNVINQFKKAINELNNDSVTDEHIISVYEKAKKHL